MSAARPTDELSTPAADEIYARVTWRLVPFLFLCYICAYLDRVNVGFAKLQMLDALGFSEAVYGLGAGIFFLGYFLFEVPSNLLMLRIGARRTIARIMIAWGAISSAMMLVDSAPVFYALRFLLGVAEAGFFPGVVLYLTFWFPAARRGRVIALFATAVAIATVIGAPLSGVIMSELDGLAGWSGWQWLFLLEGLPSVAMGLVALRVLDDRVADARWLSAAERALIARDIAAEAGSIGEQRLIEGFNSRWIWLLATIYFTGVMGLYGLNFWLPTIIKELGYVGLIQIGLITAIPFGTASVVMVLVGRHADRSGERRWHMVVPLLLGAAGLFASVTLTTLPVLAVAALTVGACGILSALPQTWNLVTTFVTGSAAAAGIALINSFGNLSGFIGPYALGWIKTATGSTAIGVCLLAASLVVCASLVLVVPAARVNRR